jgi:DNA topoisomerase IB
MEVDDADVARIVRARLRRVGCGERLLAHRNRGQWTELHADDLNARFKELVGEEYSVKDLRTWHGTVLAAEAFVDADPPVNEKVIKRVVPAVMKEVAEALGNTPAVARGSYVDPRVVAAYEQERTIAAAVRRAARCRAADRRQAILEKATRTLIRRLQS